MNFDRLVQSISDIHRQLQAQAAKAVITEPYRTRKP